MEESCHLKLDCRMVEGCFLEWLAEDASRNLKRQNAGILPCCQFHLCPAYGCGGSSLLARLIHSLSRILERGGRSLCRANQEVPSRLHQKPIHPNHPIALLTLNYKHSCEILCHTALITSPQRNFVDLFTDLPLDLFLQGTSVVCNKYINEGGLTFLSLQASICTLIQLKL